ncbi:AAA family ATPase [Deinococcus sp. LM3]|uniref:ATP-binding protein n=1 Tax=Deinococcus sp. LM3 TaxID=1938608 RepID=UPI0009933248|nr:AAA family ATPase [Deinococcus sp. LM3]OOV14333.1 hypothetical protein BXU09_06255 [Deinococcus sp. LM3]
MLARLLGHPHVRVGDTWTDLPGSKPALLLTVLLLRSEWITRDQLAEMLFPGLPQSQARTNLRVCLSRATALPWAAGLEVQKHRLRLQVDTDVAELRRALQAGDCERVAQLYAPLLQGLSLAQLPGLAEHFEAEGRALHAECVDALTRAAARHRASGDTRGALRLLERVLSLDPLAEDTTRRALELCHDLHERERGLKLYAALRRALHDAGAEPLPATQDLAAALGRQPVRALPGTLRRADLLAGRDCEAAQLAAALPGVALMSGPAGMGKTTLLRHVLPGARYLSAQEGLQHVPYHPLLPQLRREPPSLGPYREDLARLLPDLYPDVVPAPFDPGVGQVRLLEALSRALLDGGPPLILDDAQWADDATLDWLAYAADRPGDGLVVAFRSDEPSDALRRALTHLERQATTYLHLEPLDPAALGAWLGALGGEGTPYLGGLCDWLAEHSGGTPLYALEHLRALFEAGVLRAAPGGWQLRGPLPDAGSWPPAPQLQALVQRRLARLSRPAQQVLAALSLAPDATEDTLAEVLGQPLGAVLDALDAAAAAAFLQEGRLHDLLRRAVSAALPVARRQLLHRQLAEHLSRRDPHDPALIRHWTQAGLPQRAWPARAAHAANLLGGGRVEAAAHEWRALLGELPAGHPLEAPAHLQLGRALFWQDLHVSEAHLRAALDLIEWGQHGPDDLLKLEALLALAELTVYEGRGQEAEEFLNRALTLATGPLPPALHRTLTELRVEVGFRRGQYDAARALIRAEPHPWPLLMTLDALGDFFAGHFQACAQRMTGLLDTYPVLAHQNAMEADIGLCLLLSGQPDRAREVLRRGLARTDLGPHMHALMLTHLGHAALAAGQLAEADMHLKHALTLADDLGSLTYRADILHRLSLLREQAGDRQGALDQADKAARCVREVSDPYREVYIMATHAGLLAAHGDTAQARALLDGCALQADTPPLARAAYHRARALLHHAQGDAPLTAQHTRHEEALCRTYGMTPLTALLPDVPRTFTTDPEEDRGTAAGNT